MTWGKSLKQPHTDKGEEKKRIDSSAVKGEKAEDKKNSDNNNPITNGLEQKKNKTQNIPVYLMRKLINSTINYLCTSLSSVALVKLYKKREIKTKHPSSLAQFYMIKGTKIIT